MPRTKKIQPIVSEDFSKIATEQRNPRSLKLDKLSTRTLVKLFTDEERYVQNALRAKSAAITKACDLIAKKLISGGRLFYVGAGTSGRLGIVDAAEMPPTFNAPPEQVQAIMAGGPAAVFKSQEGVEDSPTVGAAAVRERKVGVKDVVVGIAASGRTPFVLGAMMEAKRRKAAVIFLTCNPNRKKIPGLDVAIDLPTGPELVTGSTRMKAGTVTKLVLNMFSTIAMIRLGRVKSNFMINVQATNEKLRDRCVRLVMMLVKCNREQAAQKLNRTNWSVAKAISSQKS
jgi:N-acetylmuramic acid 6-phosphate etherase